MASLKTGQAGTPLDWDDGKEFGELRWRERPGIFDRKHYPIDNAAELRALRLFLRGLEPDYLRPAGAPGAAVRCLAPEGLRVFALDGTGEKAGVYGWLFAPGAETKFRLQGLAPGEYWLGWFDPWTGRLVPGREPERLTIGPGGEAEIDAAAPLARLRAAAPPFPEKSRLARGQDAAFRLGRRRLAAAAGRLDYVGPEKGGPYIILTNADRPAGARFHLRYLDEANLRDLPALSGKRARLLGEEVARGREEALDIELLPEENGVP